MQQVKMYTPGMFKGEARQQFWKDIKKMEKNGWRVHTVTDTGVGNDQAHTGRLTVVYEKQVKGYLRYFSNFNAKAKGHH